MTIKCKLVAKQDGFYTQYVFENEDYTNSTDRYIMCTRVPNWHGESISLHDIGYLQYKIVNAGESYYNLNTDSHEIYKYSGCYFINFIKRVDETQGNNFKY